jgi:predicted helicase
MRLKNPSGPSPNSGREESTAAGFKTYDALEVNDTLTLEGIPPEAFDYRLGNRSALEWVVDQYRITRDARSGITSDPNRSDDPEYIVRLVERVVRVSVETVKLVAALPEIGSN